MKRLVLLCGLAVVGFTFSVGCSEPQPTNASANADAQAIADYEAAIAAEANVDPTDGDE